MSNVRGLGSKLSQEIDELSVHPVDGRSTSRVYAVMVHPKSS